jgi:hypothetical protein
VGDTSNALVSIYVGIKKPGFSYRKTSLAAAKHLQTIPLRLWSAKNPVSALPPERVHPFNALDLPHVAEDQDHPFLQTVFVAR